MILEYSLSLFLYTKSGLVEVWPKKSYQCDSWVFIVTVPLKYQQCCLMRYAEKQWFSWPQTKNEKRSAPLRFLNINCQCSCVLQMLFLTRHGGFAEAWRLEKTTNPILESPLPLMHRSSSYQTATVALWSGRSWVRSLAESYLRL